MGSTAVSDLQQCRIPRYPPSKLGHQGEPNIPGPKPLTLSNLHAKTNFSQPFFTFWDHFLGTVWTGGDVSARYERAKLAAQKKLDCESTASSITNTDPSASATRNHRPYEHDLRDAVLLRSVDPELQQPSAPAGKAEQQAAGSREQVLEDAGLDDGAQILLEEALEEKEARSMIRRSNRRRTASSLTQSEGLRGFRERVSIHGRTGGILGMEHSH